MGAWSHVEDGGCAGPSLLVDQGPCSTSLGDHLDARRGRAARPTSRAQVDVELERALRQLGHHPAGALRPPTPARGSLPRAEDPRGSARSPGCRRYGPSGGGVRKQVLELAPRVRRPSSRRLPAWHRPAIEDEPLCRPPPPAPPGPVASRVGGLGPAGFPGASPENASGLSRGAPCTHDAAVSFQQQTAPIPVSMGGVVVLVHQPHFRGHGRPRIPSHMIISTASAPPWTMYSWWESATNSSGPFHDALP